MLLDTSEGVRSSSASLDCEKDSDCMDDLYRDASRCLDLSADDARSCAMLSDWPGLSSWYDEHSMILHVLHVGGREDEGAESRSEPDQSPLWRCVLDCGDFALVTLGKYSECIAFDGADILIG
jgi:hypothetical protein